jgi:hypothetical protein
MRLPLSLLALLLLCASMQAADMPHTLALGATVVGAQLHWGFASKWALEVRALRDQEKEESDTGTITAYATGLRAYRYFRPATAGHRTRIYMGLEAASTRSTSDNNDYKTSGFAFGGFGGAEIYLLRRLSLGLDMGPYVISSKVRGGNTSSGEMSVVVNTYMNFYLL